MTIASPTTPVRPLAKISAKDARALSGQLPMWTHSVAELECWPPERLLNEAQRTIEREQRFPPELAQRLDDVFLAKTQQLLAAPQHAQESDFRTLGLLIGSIASDQVEDELDAMPERYGARWKVLSDLMGITLKVRDFRDGAAARHRVPQHSWERVADAILGETGRGLSWGELAAILADAMEGPKSKGGISQLLTSMHAKGWVESFSRGRNKYFFAGPNISESEAWKRRNVFHAPAGHAMATALPEPSQKLKLARVAKAVAAPASTGHAPAIAHGPLNAKRWIRGKSAKSGAGAPRKQGV
ncbi:hypothetical protein [Variovorax rhizosphaerae]|uniref:MarR family transcriptional regulator n=1 Tax=Variovorax rhizosphaerae TaxID=1836200 RepID=A0ABU8X162_9BURK